MYDCGRDLSDLEVWKQPLTDQSIAPAARVKSRFRIVELPVGESMTWWDVAGAGAPCCGRGAVTPIAGRASDSDVWRTAGDRIVLLARSRRRVLPDQDMAAIPTFGICRGQLVVTTVTVCRRHELARVDGTQCWRSNAVGDSAQTINSKCGSNSKGTRCKAESLGLRRPWRCSWQPP